MNKTWVESLPYPSGFMKWVYKLPIFFYRLGLWSVLGRLFMIMTAVGRKSGQPRRTAIEFQEFRGRKYIFSAWGKRADWFRNIETNPHVTIQTWWGAENVLARRITSELELAEAFEFAMSNPSMRIIMKSFGFEMTLDQFIAQKERFTFITFDPTDQSTPEPLKADLWWAWILIVPICVVLTMFLI